MFVASFHRPNLRLAAAPKVGETAQLLDVSGTAQRRVRHRLLRLARARPSGSRRDCSERNFRLSPFHAGLDPAHKRASLTRFRSGEPVVVVATIAFGMGIDRPDVRFVVHLDMPDSPEACYQQIGRAGRDGEPAEGLLLYGGQDIAQARHWLAQSAAPDAQKHVMRAKLEEMIALTETASCRTAALLACFGETLPEPCGALRQLPGAAQHGRCHRGIAKTAVGGVSHRADFWRVAFGCGAARREDRRGAAPRP